MNAAAQGEQALKDSNAPLAIQHYTRALAELPRAVNYYIQRSTAHSRVKSADGGPNSLASLRDAETALALARERGKRELILAAQMRRGVALFQLGRYHDAKFLFDLLELKTKSQDGPEDKSASLQAAMSGSGSKKEGAELQIWKMQVARKLKDLGGFDEAAVTVVEFPSDTRIPTEKELKAELESLKAGKAGPVANESKKRTSQPTSSAAAVPTQQANEGTEDNKAPVAAVSEKVRHEWYQSNDSVVVTLYIKGLQKDSVQVDMKDESVNYNHPHQVTTTFTDRH